MSNIDFDKLYPWRGIELVTIDEQEMVKIPKFYVKVGIAPAGTDQAGKKCWWISDTKRNGYHVHPAFMKNGKEIEQFYVCLLYTSPSPRDRQKSRMPSSA